MSEATKRNLRPDSLTLIQLDDLETAVINNDFIVKEHLLAAIRMARTLRGQASPPEVAQKPDAVDEFRCALSTIAGLAKANGSNALHEISCTALAGIERLKIMAEETTPSPRGTITCPDTQKPCADLCDPSKGDRCAKTGLPLPQNHSFNQGEVKCKTQQLPHNRSQQP